MSTTITSALQTHIQKTLVEGLKLYFRGHADYTFSENIALTKIQIFSEFPKRIVKYPCITLGNITGDPLLRTIGSQQHRIIKGTRYINGLTISNAICGILSGGGHYVNVDLHIAGMSQAEKRIIKDEIPVFLNIIARDYLETSGLHLKTISLGGAREVLIGNEYIHWDGMSISFYTEWSQARYDTPIVSSVILQGLTASY